MKKEIVLLVISLIIIILGCLEIYSQLEDISWRYQDSINLIRQYDDHYFLFRCLWQDINDRITQSEFCVIAQLVTITSKKEENRYRLGKLLWISPKSEWLMPGSSCYHKEGRMKIQSVIYGDPKTDELSFAYSYDDKDFRLSEDNTPWAYHRFAGDYSDELAHFLYSEPNSIVLGAGKGKDARILRAIGQSTGLISVNAIKQCKEVNKNPKPQQDWLLNSNDRELLLFLFTRSLPTRDERMDEREKGKNTRKSVALINTLTREGTNSPERRFLSYGCALFLLYEFHEGKSQWCYAQLDDGQRQVLIDIATEKLGQVTCAGDGIKYLRLIGLFTYGTGELGGPFSPFKEVRESGMKLFERVPDLKDKLQPVVLTLSEKFKNEPDFPEWAKWVNKIFPARPAGGPPDEPKNDDK